MTNIYSDDMLMMTHELTFLNICGDGPKEVDNV